MEAADVPAIQECVERMMNADDSEIRPLADKVVELVERLNSIVGAKRADITGILPEEDATGASITDGPATEEEGHVGMTILVNQAVQKRSRMSIGGLVFLDGKGSCCLK
jgi:hypothetical protein